MKHPQVVVVGAGPVGLSLALGLARQGCRVLVLERNATTAEHSRAPAIWPKTQEVLATLGVIDLFLSEGIVMPQLALHDADRHTNLLSLPLAELAPDTAYPHLLILPQSRTEKLLLTALEQEPTAEVRFSREVTELVQHQDKVEVHFCESGVDSQVETEFVAGCDGAHSTTRKAINARLEGITYNLLAALADIRLDPRQSFPSPRLTTRPRLVIGIQMADTLWRMILPFRESEDIPLAQRVDTAARHLFPGSVWQSVWQSEFRLHNRVSTSFCEGRIVLAGDAAHLNSPVGGQGMNAGIQDTAFLSQAMLQALNQGSHEPLVEFAHLRRQEVQQQVNRFTDLLTRILLTGNGRLFRPALLLTNVAMQVTPLRQRLMKRMAMLE